MSAQSLEALLQTVGNPVELARNSQIGPYVYPKVPSEFSNWRDEQRAWRETSCLFDQSHHMTDLTIKGPDALKLLSATGVNSFATFAVNKAKQFVACNYDGQVIGDAILFYLDENVFSLVGRRYVPPDYAADYETGGLDDYGSWVYVPAYDQYCWRPSVLSDWRPYTAGTWRWTPCGLTWVSYEPWGWLPYHYGTWTFDPEFGWIWLPGSFYSPAWVYWNYTDDYVGWCPIGYYGYDGPAYRARRTWFGDSRSIYYPHLSGRVAVTRPRGGPPYA